MKAAKSLRILHVVGSLDRSWGGLSLYVAELATELAAHGHRVKVLCQPGVTKDQWPAAGVELLQAKPGSSEWRTALESAELVHVHGLWLPFYHEALAVARRLEKPYLLSVHGMLEPGALAFAKWKKRLALRLYQRRDLQVAPLLHATADPELKTLRALKLRQPVATLPPGVRIPEARTGLSKTGPVRRALFLGRIHPKKGILSLIDAWTTLRPKDWKLDLAGPDEAGHLAEVRRTLRERKLEQEVIYRGATFGETKEQLLREASLLIAPSLSENFGIVVVEGLAHSLPVITTTGTPWQVLQREGCGWWVPYGANSLTAALREAVALSPDQLEKMGRLGRKLAESEFDWSRIATLTGDLYAWLIAGGDPPPCVSLS
jgi:glycosyltransferase involved in cell wall biosynthesis